MTEKTGIHIHPDMTILDVVSAHPDTIGNSGIKTSQNQRLKTSHPL